MACRTQSGSAQHRASPEPGSPSERSSTSGIFRAGPCQATAVVLWFVVRSQHLSVRSRHMALDVCDDAAKWLCLVA
ncbi:hypothetical protein MRB53_039013 [Persea americana]|nr:hypothetical protein MRB53_039013 [Persea americana]